MDYVTQNARAWDEIAEVRHRRTQPADYYAAGNTSLNPQLIDAAGDVHGKSLLQLQCATGEETISWALLGADAEGVDISSRQISLARHKAKQAGVRAAFHVGDVCALPAELTSGRFDVVHTGGGSLMWVPDVRAWARSVSSALKVGGQLLLLEEHPVSGCLILEDGLLRTDSDYFGRGEPTLRRGWRHFEGGEDAQELKYQFVWPLGDVITSLAVSGMRIDSLAEFPSRARWRFGDDLDRMAGLPGGYLLVATREPPLPAD